jgi:hypothetical protein
MGGVSYIMGCHSAEIYLRCEPFLLLMGYRQVNHRNRDIHANIRYMALTQCLPVS